MGKQVVVIRIDEQLVRRVFEFLADEQHGYTSINEFAEIALRNQLNLEQVSAVEIDGGRKAISSRSSSLLARPEIPIPDNLADEPRLSREALFVLTNRLSPIKIAARVLANLARGGEWPQLRDFQEQAARAARELGLRMRAEDEKAGRSGRQRRWIGYPVGSDERAALDRFVYSFTMIGDGDRISGPLLVLGLANMINGRALLSKEGWHLASAPSPLLGETYGLTLSVDEIDIFRRRLPQATGELEAIREFMQLVKRAAGQQQRLDELILTLHPEWTVDLANAHRSAMIGRLSDLGVIEVSGRGRTATIDLKAETDFGVSQREEGERQHETFK